MDRGERRRRTERAKRRRLSIVYGHATGPSYATFDRLDQMGNPWSLTRDGWFASYFVERPWRYAHNVKQMTMQEYGPRSWTHPMMVRPARGKQNQMLRAGDFEGAFPDYRKPKVYCW